MGRELRSLRNTAAIKRANQIKPRIQRRLRLEDEIAALDKGLTDLPATSVAYDNTSSGLTADNVQDALDEIDGAVDDLVAATSAWTTTNDSVQRSVDADAAAGAISDPPTQAEVEGVRDAVLALADAVATLIADLQSKDILS